MKKQKNIFTSLIFLLFSSSSLAVTFSQITDLPGGSSVNSRALSISGDGNTVTGFGISAQGFEAYKWTQSGGITGIGELPGGGFESDGWGVSQNGNFIVGVSKSTNGFEAFRWTSGTMAGLGDLAGGTFSSIAFDVSDDGSVVVGRGNSGSSEAFRWQSGTMTGLGFLPGGSIKFSQANAVSADGSTVVGNSISSSGNEAFSWSSGSLTGLGDLPGGSFASTANDISADGTVIVGQGASITGDEASLWIAGKMFGLGDLPGSFVAATATATSLDGSVIVGNGTTGTEASPVSEAFIWDEIHGMRNLKDLLTARGIDMTGWQLTEATGISENGKKITGFGTNPGGDVTGWIVQDMTYITPGDFNGDFNGDGKTDILWHHRLNGVSWIYHMNGKALLSQGPVAGTELSWQIAGIGDFDNDGKDDILWRNYATGINWIYLMNGNTVKTSAALSYAPLQWFVSGIGDFDGDGQDDILWSKTEAGGTALHWIFLMGDTTTNPMTVKASNGLTRTALGLEVSGIGDFNNDGKDDILWRNVSNQKSWVFIMNATQANLQAGGGAAISTSTSLSNAVSSHNINWDVIGIGDFNNDGSDDIVWRNNSTGANMVYLVNNTAVTSETTIVGLTSDTSLQAKQVADFDGDGDQDILFSNNSTGVHKMATLAGTTQISLDTIVTVNPDWKINGQ